MARKQTLSSPIIHADEAFYNDLIAKRDDAVSEEAWLRAKYVSREGFYQKELERLEAKRMHELKGLSEQIARAIRIIQGADAALTPLTGDK